MAKTPEAAMLGRIMKPYPAQPLRTFLASAALLLAALPSLAQDDFLGRWALTLPGGQAGWMEITGHGAWYEGSILWGGGSVLPLSSVYFDEGVLHATRVREVKRTPEGEAERTQQFTETITARVTGDELQLLHIDPQPDGRAVRKSPFTGKRVPPLPPRPDLASVRFGEPIELLNGRDLGGWKLNENGAKNGWKIVDGRLVNETPERNGYGNLRTEAEFEDFRISLETKLPPRGNSGVYLRGIYEVQIADSHAHAPHIHGMAALYSRIAPSRKATKPPGE
jgi:hypothetical protein